MKRRKNTGEREMFIKIWQSRDHICVNCKSYLGEEPLAQYFAHIKPKSTYPELRLDENNIIILCLECHYAKDSRGIAAFNKRIKL